MSVDQFSNKEDISPLRQDLSKLQERVRQRFNNLVFWIVGTGIAITVIISLMIKNWAM